MSSKISYRQRYTRCGKQRCLKCKEGPGHGPYWYAYWCEKGRTVSKYIGLRLPAGIQEQQADNKAEIDFGRVSRTRLSPLLRIYLLGQFRAEHRSEGTWKTIDSRTWHRRHARALLGCLLSSPGRRLGREQLMEFLWPSLDRDLASNRLNGAVHELRRILEPDIERPARSKLLRLERDRLALADETYIWVDAEAFERLVKEAHASTDAERAERLLQEADVLYKGMYLLDELYSAWAAPRRDALQRAWAELLLHLAQLRTERKAFANALELLERLRIADPMNETALQRLMMLLTHLNRRGEALQAYRQYVAVLQRDYETEPLPETSHLYKLLRQGQVSDLDASKARPSTHGEQRQVHDAPLSSSASTAQEPFFTQPLFQLSRHNQSLLVGRDRELDISRQIMRAVEELPIVPRSSEEASRTIEPRAPFPESQYSHFLLFTGEPGIGKTRLAEELSVEAFTRGWTVAWSKTNEQEGTIPYHPWIEVLRTLSSQLLRDEERLHLGEAVLAFLETVSTVHPVLLVLDDLQWIDDSSIELLAYLTRHLKDQRVLFIGTCREEELAPIHRLRTLISDLQREQVIILLPVQPLPQSQIGTMVSHLPGEAVHSIQTQAAGNPFFAEELARYIRLVDTSAPLDQPAKTRISHSIPATITAVLERRLSQLSPSCQAFLGKAALHGGSFELRQMLLMAPEFPEDTLFDLIEEALFARLLTEEKTGAQIVYHFWHPLIVSYLIFNHHLC